MSYVPRVRFSQFPKKFGPGGTSTCWNYDYSALLVSQNHQRNRSGGYSDGGPFYVWRKLQSHTVLLHAYYLGSYGEYWLGAPSTPMSANIPITNMAVIQPGTIPAWSAVKSDVESHSAAGYKRTRPGNPVASLGQFLIELRDFPTIPFRNAVKKGFKPVNNRPIPISQVGRVLRDRVFTLKNLGSEYLNVVFGWKPLVNDLRKMYNLWKTIDKRMAQIVRENGHGIRRRVTISEDRTVVTEPVALWNYPFGGFISAQPAGSLARGWTQTTVQRTSYSKVWFAGNYRYYIPDTGSSQWNARARLALFGALPTPELLWEVLPWSWLVDWFSNVGDVISNASSNAVDNLTLNSSWVMKHSYEETTITSQVSQPKLNGPVYSDALDHTFTDFGRTESKVRSGGGNPFGINVQLDSLSTYQLSILAALGISRGRVR